MAQVTLIAGQAISRGAFVRINPSGLLINACADYVNNARPIGVALNAANAAFPVTVETDGRFDQYTGLTIGEQTYLSLTSGQMYGTYSDFETALSATTLSGAYAVEVGRAVSTDEITIEISQQTFVRRV